MTLAAASLFVSPACPPLAAPSRSRVVIAAPLRPLFARRLSARRPLEPPTQPPSAPPRASLSPPPNTLPVTLFNTTIHLSARLVLLCVPMLWASYGICLKCLYTLPWALPPALFNLLRLTVASLTTLPALLHHLQSARSHQTRKLPVRTALVAGFELGMWTFVVNMLQIVGLRHTTAARGAFLSQMSTIIVPIAAFLCGMEPSIPRAVLLACVVSVFGVALLTLDNVSATFSWLGDGMMLLVAFMATVYILRSKQHSAKAHAGPLVPAKVIGQTFFALLYFSLSLLAMPASVSGGAAAVAGGALAWMAGATPVLVLANVMLVLWAGVCICWLSTVLQMRGQSLVSASEAVIIFTSTPLWAALMAWPLGERFGPRGIVGAALILCATAVASKAEGDNKAA